MKNIIFIFLITILCIQGINSNAQQITSEIEKMGFIARSRGIYASKINPAGLAITDNDDGFMLNYSFAEHNENPEHNFLLSIGDIGFAYQKDENELNDEPFNFNSFDLSLSVGNSFVAIGNRTKFIETEYLQEKNNLINADVGIMIRPVDNISFGGMIRDLVEKQYVAGFEKSKMKYAAGVSFLLFNNSLSFNSESHWDESSETLEDAIYKVGINFYPKYNLNLTAIVERLNDSENYYHAGIFLNLEGISIGVSAHSEDEEKIERYSATFRASLQSVKF